MNTKKLLTVGALILGASAWQTAGANYDHGDARGSGTHNSSMTTGSSRAGTDVRGPKKSGMNSGTAANTSDTMWNDQNDDLRGGAGPTTTTPNTYRNDGRYMGRDGRDMRNDRYNTYRTDESFENRPSYGPADQSGAHYLNR